MSSYEEVARLADKISKEYSLCDNCLGRLFSKTLHLSSNKRLGKKLNKVNLNKNYKCYICKNFFSNIHNFLKLMVESSSNYSFSTYSVGIIIKHSIVDRDDFIRSKYKLKRIDSIKTDVVKELGKLFSRKTQKIIDHFDPDLTFTLNLKDHECFVRSKSITLSGRYNKFLRGIPQKQPSCKNCSGKGCRECSFHGISEFNSVEGIISRFLFTEIGGTTAKFTWIGGEDKSSLVLGSGRPFFVKIQNPQKRIIGKKTVNFNSIKVNKLKIIEKSPIKPLRFHSYLKIKIKTNNVESKSLRTLKNLKFQPIIVYDKSGKRSVKHIISIKYSKKSNDEFQLFLKVEGGFPVKRFVVGDDVFPNVSNLLNDKCCCETFDVLGVEIG